MVVMTTKERDAKLPNTNRANTISSLHGRGGSNYIAILLVDMVHRQVIYKQPNKKVQGVDLEIVIVHMDVFLR